MKTPTEHDELLADVLAENASPDFRAASLEETLAAARWERRQRRAARVAGVALCAAAITALAWRGAFFSSPRLAKSISAPPAPSPSAAKTIPGTHIRLVSDEELLAMFPGRPVALVGPPEDRKFVFLDEERNAKAHGASGKGLNL